MKGIFLTCPACKKPLSKNTYLRPGSFLTIKCFHCGMSVSLSSEPRQIKITQLSPPPVDNQNLTDDDEDDMVVLSL